MPLVQSWGESSEREERIEAKGKNSIRCQAGGYALHVNSATANESKTGQNLGGVWGCPRLREGGLAPKVCTHRRVLKVSG